jgi:hypothetical protein
MKFRTKTNLSQRGSVLVVTLCIAFIFGYVLFYYLNLASGQKTLVKRSQAWNSALGQAEAGVEEALAQLNPGAPQPVLDLTANGWGTPSGGLYGPMARSLSNGSYSVVYTTDPLPTIYSTGYVTVPALSAKLTRTLKVTTQTFPLFTAAMAVLQNINLNGNGVTTDSFDSSMPGIKSDLEGRYTPSLASTNGTIASLQGIVNIGNANIHGTVYLGPTATSTMQANALVTGGITNDFNASFEDVILPAGQPLPAQPLSAPLTINGISYQYVFGFDVPATGYYSIGGLNGNIYVGTNSHITLLLHGNANPATIRVAGSGTSAGQLTIYMDGPNLNINSSSMVDGGHASSLSYYGTTNNTSISLGGNANFTGTIYAPQAHISMGGGGSGNYNFVGAIVALSVSMSGHFNFHYDEALALHGPVGGFVAKSWSEL